MQTVKTHRYFWSNIQLNSVATHRVTMCDIGGQCHWSAHAICTIFCFILLRINVLHWIFKCSPSRCTRSGHMILRGGVKAYCQSVGLIQAGQLTDRQIMIGSGVQTIIKTPLSGRIAEAIRIWYLGSLCGDRWKNTADKGGRRASLKDWYALHS